jgi:hypothetical protein
MEIGATGANGRNAVQLVDQERNEEEGNATILNHNLKEKNVMERRKKPNLVK